MKKIYVIFSFLLLILQGAVKAQSNVLDPNDPDVIFTSSYRPPVPTWGKMSKWGHAKRLSWDSYKAGYRSYYFKGMAFRLKFPKTYQHNIADGKKYPVYIFFHGLGERDTIYDNEYSLLAGAQQHAQKVDDGTFDGFLLYPQNQTGYFDAYFGAIAGLIDSLVKYVKADEDRVLLSGLSSGGQGVWPFAASYPKYVAGIMPIAAARKGDTTSFSKYITVPVRTANGGQDINPTAGEATVVFDAFRRLGGNLKQFYYPTVGHSAWDSFWREPDYYPYLSTIHKANPLVYFGRTEFCPGDAINVKLGVQAGFYAYEWQKDGATIPGATANNLTVTQYGTYRARFKRTATSNWSDWSPTPVAIVMKQPTVTPPIQINGIHSNVLPAPDGNISVPLMVPSQYVSYEWRRVADNALVSDTSLYNAAPGQYKVKVTEQYGCSSDFSPVYTVINANGTNVPDKATSLTAVAPSNTRVQLDWSQNPTPQNNETGFEIYRSTVAGGPYTMMGLTIADAGSFLDTMALPNTKYYYIVRAINDNGAAPVSTEVSVTTKADIQAPTSPGELHITATTRNAITLSWNPSTDDVAVTRYEVYINGVKNYSTTENQFTVNNLDSFHTYTFYVKAVDPTNNLSEPSNQVTGITRSVGLTYKYYEGTWTMLPDFSKLKPAAFGITANVNLAPRQADLNYGFLWEGYINIRIPGTYYFETNSDDGSKLYIGSYGYSTTPIVNNDGKHGAQYKGGNYTFSKAGIYPIAITFFQSTGGQSMNVYWTCSAAGINSRTLIPDSAFVEVILPAGNIPLAPGNLKATVAAYNTVNLQWSDNSDNETGFELYRSTSLYGTYSTVAIIAANTTTFTDTTCTAASTYYYRLKAVGQYGESAFANSQPANTPVTSAAQWQFNNNYNDASGSGRVLVPARDPVFDSIDNTEGAYALKLNGTTQYVTIRNTGGFLLNGFSQRTVALWIKAQSTSDSRIVYTLGANDYGVGLSIKNNVLSAGVANASERYQASTPYTSKDWNHITLVYNKNSLRLYINGILAAANDSLPYSTIAPTTRPSYIGSYSTYGNIFNIPLSKFSGWVDDMVIVDGALTASDILALIKNSHLATTVTTPALPAAPEAPSSLSATAVSSSRIQLSWQDNSTVENGFELWRSTGDTSAYRLIATLGAGQVTYTDSALYGHVAYYYKVRSVGTGGASAFSDVAHSQTLNQSPVVAALPNVMMRFDTQKSISLSANDPDGDAVTFSVDNPPSFVALTNGNGEAATLTMAPNSSEQGTYPINLKVSDSYGGTITQSFTLTVNSNYAPEVNAIADVTLAEGSQNDIALTATDADGLNGLQWTTSALPAFATLVPDANGTATLHLKPGYAHSGSYIIAVTATDAVGASDSRSFTVTITENNPATNTVYASIRNYPYSNPAPAPWNSISGLNTPALKNSQGQSTSMGLTFLTNSWNTESMGAVTGNNSGVYPDDVLKDHYWFGIWGRPDTVQLKLTGLDNAFKYNVTLFASSTYNYFADNGSTTYRINDISKSLYVQNNQNRTVTFSNLEADGTGSLIITMKKDPNAGGWLNALVVQQVFDDGTTPVLPTGLAAKAQPDGSIQLRWRDVAYNEKRYEVYRSTEANGTYMLLNSGVDNAGDTLYNDKSTIGNTTYYYKLLAVNDNGTSGYTDLVSAATGNKAPVWTVVNDIFLKGGSSTTVNVTATDDAGDNLTVQLSGLPSFAQYQNTGNGSGQIMLNPGATVSGTYHISATVSDSYGASATQSFMVVVADKNTRSVYVNIGPENGAPAGQPWNNLLSYPFPNLVLKNLKDESDMATPFNFTIIDAFGGRFSGGMVTGNNSGVYDDAVLQGAFFESTTAARRFKFSGLNTAKKYNIAIASSLNSGAEAVATFTAGGRSITINAKYNSSQAAQLNGLSPDSNGEILVTMTKASASNWAILNAVVLEEYDPALAIVNPVNLVAQPDANIGRIILNWSDRTDNESGYEIWRAASATDNFNLLATVAANVTTYTDKNLPTDNRYYYQVRAKSGSNFSDYSNIASAVVAKKAVYLNFEIGESPAPVPWNNAASQLVEGVVINNLNDNTGKNTGFGLSMLSHFNDEHDQGVSTGNNSGVYPDAVMRSTCWLDVNQIVSYKLTGLNQSKTYRIWFTGSWMWGYAADFTTTYTIGGQTVYLNSYNNSTKAVYIDGVQPDENGEVKVDISAPPTSIYGFQSALVIEYYDPALINAERMNNSEGATNQLVISNRLAVAATAQAKDRTTATVIYPNPFRSQLTVAFTIAGSGGPGSLRLYDMAGRLMLQKQWGHRSAGRYSETLNVEALPKGTYFIHLTGTADENKTVKVIKN